jgi:hypothetical protein
MWKNVTTFCKHFLALLTPQPVKIEISLDRQLSDAIAQAVRDDDFRRQLIAHPKATLAHLKIQLPAHQNVIVVESTAEQTFLVLPLMTDREIDELKSGLNSDRSLRATRSRILLKAWHDRDYNARLIAAPKSVLRDEGFDLPENTQVTVLKNDLEHLHLVIPCLH